MKSQPTPNSSSGGGSRTEPQGSNLPITESAMSPSENDSGTATQPTASNADLLTPSLYSEDYMNLQYYGSYNSHQDFYRIRHENASHEDVDRWSPASREPNLLEAASDWFGSCFGCDPRNDGLPTREQSSNGEKSDNFLADNESSTQPSKTQKEGHQDKGSNI
jgi:hypothetical protein